VFFNVFIPFLIDDNSTFSVRPMAFWSDKILEKEIQKQVPSTPPKPRVLVEKKVCCIFGGNAVF
jgi:hypothetical protein